MDIHFLITPLRTAHQMRNNFTNTLKFLVAANYKLHSWLNLSVCNILCDAMMHVLKDFINLKYSELLTEEISKSN